MQNYYRANIGIKSIFYFCALPLRLDSYRGCSYNCLYCFSANLNCRNDIKTILPAMPQNLEILVSGNSNIKILNSCVERKIPFHFGSTSDPFQECEEKYQVSYKHLLILHKYRYPYVLSTKSDLITNAKYLELIKDSKCFVQISFSTFNDTLASKLEPNVCSPRQRIHVIKELVKNNVHVIVRIQPFLYPYESVSMLPIEELSNIGVKHIIFEHLRIPVSLQKKRVEELNCVFNEDVKKRFTIIGSKYSRVSQELNSRIKLKNILELREITNKYNITLGCGDNEFHHLSGSNCCGIPYSHEYNLYDGHFASMINCISKESNVYCFIDSRWHPEGSVNCYINSNCRLKGLKSIKDYLFSRINNPNLSNSIKHFYGVDILLDKVIKTEEL